MSYTQSSFTDYTIRINHVFRYIEEHLDSDLSLDLLSEVAFFSPFHFHRIFKQITGETLHEYITRRRIEKSASDLLHKKISISEIFLSYGFSSHASFTRTFRKFYSINPSEFRKQHPHKFSKIRQIMSKNGQEYPNFEPYICMVNQFKDWIKMNAKIEIKRIPTMNVAYVPSIGPQNLETAYQKLIRWATPKQLFNESTQVITIYHDSFKITEADKVRMSACITLDKPIKPEGEIDIKTIEGGNCIVGSFEIGLDEFEKSWTGLYIWMNENSYTKANRDPFEIYHNDFHEHPEKKCIVDFCIPIE